MVDHDDVAAPRMGHRQAERELVGLAPAAHEEADAKRRREVRGQSLGVPLDRGMQVSGVGVEHRRLALHGSHDVRMAMTDVCDVVDDVKVSAPRDIIQVLHVASHDHERRAIRDAQGGADPLSA